MRALRCFAALLILLVAPHFYPAAIPDRLSNEEFWESITEFSESGGQFPSENFVSNEQNSQMVLTRLRGLVAPGQAYLGVGPEQNFTYIAGLQPRIAFIVDIRPQNMIEHLVYKSIFERSATRSEFIAMLLSRKPASGVGENSTAEELFNAYRGIRSDEQELARNVKAVRDNLVNVHRFKLGASDLASVEYILQMFALHGTNISYASTLQNVGASRQARGNMPDYAALMTATDENGINRGFLGSESSYLAIRDMERKNLIVPIVGDFGGTKAIRAVGRYLAEHDVKVGAFYLSNVEQYLFSSDVNGPANGGAQNFFNNVATLPLTPSSMFIRSSGGSAGSQTYPGFQSLLSPMTETVQAFKEGRVKTYPDVLGMSK